MYVPTHFAAGEDDVRRLLADHGAADLVTQTDEGLVATLLPFIHDPDDGPHGALVGHIARSNDHWRQSVTGDALVIVRGPDAYVSPSWYPSKAEHGRVVPTWNYVTAHVYGRLEWRDDAGFVEQVVRRLTAKHERALGAARPWSVDDAPRPFIEGQLRGVVGIHLEITRIEAKVKMSQNRPAADAAAVVAGLAARGDDATAGAVRAANSTRW
jgi:transcriptional regulator